MQDPAYTARDRIVALVQAEAKERRAAWKAGGSSRELLAAQRLERLAGKLRQISPEDRAMKAACMPWMDAEPGDARQAIDAHQRRALHRFGTEWVTEEPSDLLMRLRAWPGATPADA